MLNAKPVPERTVPATHHRSEEAKFLGRLSAAALLDVNPQTIDKLIRQGKLHRYNIGRRVLVSREELVRLVERTEI